MAAPNGAIIISVPNSRHHSVISGLINGNWSYERAGLLDEDHVRCFTKRELEKMLFRCGFLIEALWHTRQWVCRMERRGKTG